MFCGKCGTENVEGTPFCAGCGADLGGGKSKSKLKVGKFNLDLKNRKTLIALGAGVLALVVVLVLLFGGNSPKKVADKFMNAYVDADAKGMMKVVHDDIIDQIMEDEDMDKDDWNDQLDELSEGLEAMYEQMEDYYDGKLKLTYEVKSEKDMKGDDLDDLKDEYEDEYDLKVKDAKLVKVKLTVKCGDYKESETMELVVVKIGGKWYIDPNSMPM